MPDIRVWKPDETCEPFEIEVCGNAADLFLGRFTVPAGMKAVIAHVCTQTGTVAVKSIQRLVIARGVGDPADRSRDLTLCGSLNDVGEFDSGGAVPGAGTKATGLILALSSFPRPCRIVLNPDTYEIYHVGTTGIVVATFTGWTYRELAR